MQETGSRTGAKRWIKTCQNREATKRWQNTTDDLKTKPRINDWTTVDQEEPETGLTDRGLRKTRNKNRNTPNHRILITLHQNDRRVRKPWRTWNWVLKWRRSRWSSVRICDTTWSDHIYFSALIIYFIYSRVFLKAFCILMFGFSWNFCCPSNDLDLRAAQEKFHCSCFLEHKAINSL